jgi:hypothetical protein
MFSGRKWAKEDIAGWWRMEERVDGRSYVDDQTLNLILLSSAPNELYSVEANESSHGAREAFPFSGPNGSESPQATPKYMPHA